MTACMDVHGDRHSTEAKLHQVRALTERKRDGQQLMTSVQERLQPVLTGTSPAGKEPIIAEVDTLTDCFELFFTTSEELKQNLGKDLNTY